MTPPTQWATSVSRCRWVTAGWNVRGVSQHGHDMSGSTFMSWLVIVALVVMSMRHGSTRPLRSLPTVSRSRTRRVSWRAGSGCRNGRLAGMSSARLAGRSRCRRLPRRSPSSCRSSWPPGCVSMPRSRDAPSPRWSLKRWRSSCPGDTGSVGAGERADGRDRVRLRPSRASGVVGGLPHPGSRTAGTYLCSRRGRQSCR
jgi:hypothetical protein